MRPLFPDSICLDKATWRGYYSTRVYSYCWHHHFIEEPFCVAISSSNLFCTNLFNTKYITNLPAPYVNFKHKNKILKYLLFIRFDFFAPGFHQFQFLKQYLLMHFHLFLKISFQFIKLHIHWCISESLHFSEIVFNIIKL